VHDQQTTVKITCFKYSDTPPFGGFVKKIGLEMLAGYVSSKELRVKQYETFEKMEPSSLMNIDGLREVGEADTIDYSSVRTVIGAFVKLAQPETYLEIGMRRGHSLCMAVNCSPQPLTIYSFDLWIPNYAGEENPGLDLILKETIPAFFDDPSNPKHIDLMFVDGDHSAEGAQIDLLNVIEHVSVGGLLVFDDIFHPLHMYLLDVWREVMKQYPDFKVLKNTKHEYRWTVALRTY
jgi:predicted O-methyltransferase YrrM